MSPTRTLRFPVFCPAHPTADLRVVDVEPPGSQQSPVTRAHLTCEACGLGWSYTLTCAPMKDHTVERLGVGARHPSVAVAVAI